MNLATAIVAIVLLACCILPIMILDRKGKRDFKNKEEEKKHENKE